MPTKPISLSDTSTVSFALPHVYRKLLVLAVLGSAFAGMIWISWLKWPDLLIDYGQQVYVPWQLSAGKVLYRDILYGFGPLSSYLHSFLFQVFGESITVLAWFNILVIGALTWLIYDLFFQLSDQLTATVCSLAFILLFAFGQYGGSGNFNFVSPYSYELPHGVALSLLCLHQFIKFSKTHRAVHLMAAFFLAGLVFLTKCEVFLALSITLFFGVIVYFKTQTSEKPKNLKILFPALLSAFAPFMMCWIYFSIHMIWSEAFYYLINPWLLILKSSQLLSSPLYQWITGTDNMGVNVFKMLAYFFLYVVIAASLIAGNRWLSRWTPHVKGYLFLWTLLMLALIFRFNSMIPWPELLRPLPLITLFLSIFCLKHLLSGNPVDIHRGPYFPLLVLSLFSCVLLLKILLNTHLFHYGFALAMPATLIFLWILVFAVPNHKPFFKQPATFYRNAILALILVFMGKHVMLSYDLFQLKNNPVGTQRDFIMDYDPRIDSKGTRVQEAIEYINQELPPETGLATIPHGNIINFMTRQPNPLYYHTFNPGQAMISGEDKYFTNLKTVSPNHILLVDTDTSILGARYFGQDYAQNVYQWIIQNYTLERQFGAVPFSGRGFGIQLLKKRSAPSE